MCADNLNIYWTCRNSSGHIRVTTAFCACSKSARLDHRLKCELKNPIVGTRICNRSAFRSEVKIVTQSLQHIVHDPLAQYLVTLLLKCVATNTMQREQGASSTMITIVVVTWHARAAFVIGLSLCMF